MVSFATWGNQLYSGERSYNIVGKAKVYLSICGFLVLASLVLLLTRGLNPSIEFSGGTQFIVMGSSETSQAVAYDVLAEDGITENVRVSALGSDSIRVQTQSLTSQETQNLRNDLAEAYDVSPDSVDTNVVGATWSQDVTQKAAKSIVIFVILVSVLITIYFRSWRTSAAALIALVNDLLVTAGFFALTQVEVSPATVIGFLTILGYSLYDTVVVFDKVREVAGKYDGQDKYTYGELVNLGVNQTLVRSINTSVVALLPVGAILFIGSLLLGAGTLTDISLALFVGIIVGTFSSIFVGAPILALLYQARPKIHEKDEKILAARAAKADAANAAGPEGDENWQASDQRVSVSVAAKQPGRHLGQSAQPKRKSRSKK